MSHTERTTTSGVTRVMGLLPGTGALFSGVGDLTVRAGGLGEA